MRDRAPQHFGNLVVRERLNGDREELALPQGQDHK
jgi:hypothetical protein